MAQGAGHGLAIAPAQDGHSQTKPVQGRGTVGGTARVTHDGAQQFHLRLHARQQGGLRDQVRAGVALHGSGPRQIFQAQRRYGRKMRQKTPRFATAHPVQHEHAKPLPPPDKGQEQAPLVPQKFRLPGRVPGGEIEGMAGEGKKGAQTGTEQPLHFHEVAPGQDERSLDVLHPQSLDGRRQLV